MPSVVGLPALTKAVNSRSWFPPGFGNTGVEFKQFGTRVDFVPIVLGNGHIRLGSAA